jgi:ABC-type polysaccharide/polyol phosphate transport system ATPase subunit
VLPQLPSLFDAGVIVSSIGILLAAVFFIFGLNGKSTLPKLIVRVLKPDRGLVKTNGSMTSVLELGIGFHGDLTVKENALVYGFIMGLSRLEIL